jgi:hypothetical protein
MQGMYTPSIAVHHHCIAVRLVSTALCVQYCTVPKVKRAAGGMVARKRCRPTYATRNRPLSMIIGSITETFLVNPNQV